MSDGISQVANIIYGPFEAGFSALQPDVACLGFQYIAGGVDTGLADAVISHICGKKRHVLDYCGGHATPYHYHQSLDCLYTHSQEKYLLGHSTKIGTALDGHGVYGKYISKNGVATIPDDLDACGGRVGVTPDSNNTEVYYYVVQEYAPYTVGCFGSKSLYPVSIQDCRKLYPGCSSTDVTITTDFGSGYYKLDCPCFHQVTHSNTDSNPGGKPGYLWPSGWGGLLVEVTILLERFSTDQVKSSLLLTVIREAFADSQDILPDYVSLPILSRTLNGNYNIIFKLSSSLSASGVRNNWGEGNTFKMSFMNAALYHGFNESSLKNRNFVFVSSTNIDTKTPLNDDWKERICLYFISILVFVVFLLLICCICHCKFGSGIAPQIVEPCTLPVYSPVNQEYELVPLNNSSSDNQSNIDNPFPCESSSDQHQHRDNEVSNSSSA